MLVVVYISAMLMASLRLDGLAAQSPSMNIAGDLSWQILPDASAITRRVSAKESADNRDEMNHVPLREKSEDEKPESGRRDNASNNVEFPMKSTTLNLKEEELTDNKTQDYTLSAFTEPFNIKDWERQPLPLRSGKKSDLTQLRYPGVNSCSHLTEQWPIDVSPSHEDAYLPWIHDVFPTADGKFIQVVAQNLRRCNTSSSDEKHLWAVKRAPQAALFQHVPVKRVRDDDETSSTNTTRYRLSNHDEADADGLATRFICRFKPTMEETLSVFNFDYDWTALRKLYKGTFNEDDGGIKSIHTSQLIFRCPVPESLQSTVADGSSVVNDYATLFVDIVPIRTPPRYGHPSQFLQPKYSAFLNEDPEQRFNPDVAFGKNHVLPLLEASGRWENIPICLPSLMQYGEQEPGKISVSTNDRPENKTLVPPKKKHRLVSCLWASAGYATRGERFQIEDGRRRLLEWLSYNELIGFDHFYLYDNSGAFSNASSSLRAVADLFPDKVTYIPWPCKICNNNPNYNDSPGERSSQYAAESSCRLRFGPHTDWIGQFDIDEYLIPMGNNSNVRSLLDQWDAEDTRIVSFGSWRAWPRWAFIDPIQPIQDPDICWDDDEPCFHLTIPSNVTLLQSYNCDRQPPGNKTRKMPAEKQLYRADYVLQHFVHYAAATVLSEMNASEYRHQGFRHWRPRAFPDRRQRFGDELTEALMIHTKAVAVQDTAGWQLGCHIDNLQLPRDEQWDCRLGIPWPRRNGTATAIRSNNKTTPNATREGWAYNCYVNDKVELEYVPQLTRVVQRRTRELRQAAADETARTAMQRP